MSSSTLPPSLNLSPSVPLAKAKSAKSKSSKGVTTVAPVWPNVVRPGDTPNVVPPVTNTIAMSLAKQKRDKDRKKELAAIRKQKCADAHEALVQLLIPPTTHQDLARVMPERELRALSHSQLAAQAARLMTTEDPLGVANNASTLYLTVEVHSSTYVALILTRVIMFAARQLVIDSMQVVLYNCLFNLSNKS